MTPGGPKYEIRQAIQEVLALGAAKPQMLSLPEPVDLERAFLDTTCLCANIHFPVDWVLLRDATRTLMKAVQLIRDQGLKHRMEAPQSFLTRINRLCIQMTHTSAKADTQRHRKKTLRQMDRLVGTVRNHARRYRDLLQQRWRQTQWTEAESQQVLQRMNNILQQLPQARKQARQRMLQGEPVPNAEKILSLYEPDIHVIVRKKAGAEVEFGNTLFLVENPQGLILDWELFRESAPADARCCRAPWSAWNKPMVPNSKPWAADRGFDSELNRFGLAEEGIYNAVCPRILRNCSSTQPLLEIQEAATPARPN